MRLTEWLYSITCRLTNDVEFPRLVIYPRRIDIEPSQYKEITSIKRYFGTDRYEPIDNMIERLYEPT